MKPILLFGTLAKHILPGNFSKAGSLKIFVAMEPCDMRRGYNGLLALVGEKLKEEKLYPFRVFGWRWIPARKW